MRQQVRGIAHQAGDAHGVAMIRRPQCGETVAQRVAAGARLAASRSWPGAACGIGLVGRPPRCRGRSRSSRSVGVFGGGQRHPSAPARKQDRSSSRVRFTRQAVFWWCFVFEFARPAAQAVPLGGYEIKWLACCNNKDPGSMVITPAGSLTTTRIAASPRNVAMGRKHAFGESLLIGFLGIHARVSSFVLEMRH